MRQRKLAFFAIAGLLLLISVSTVADALFWGQQQSSEDAASDKKEEPKEEENDNDEEEDGKSESDSEPSSIQQDKNDQKKKNKLKLPAAPIALTSEEVKAKLDELKESQEDREEDEEQDDQSKDNDSDSSSSEDSLQNKKKKSSKEKKKQQQKSKKSKSKSKSKNKKNNQSPPISSASKKGSSSNSNSKKASDSNELEYQEEPKQQQIQDKLKDDSNSQQDSTTGFSHDDDEKSREEKKRKKREKKLEKEILEKIFYKLEKFAQDRQFRRQLRETAKYKKHHLGLKNNNKYCLKSDVHHFKHAETFINNRETLCDLPPSSPLRAALARAADLALPKVNIEMKKKLKKQRAFDFPKNLTMFLTHNAAFHNFHQPGKHFSCLFQLYSKLPGLHRITRKYELPLTVERYQRYFREKFPAPCVGEVDFLPRTLNLADASQCRQFFQVLQQEQADFNNLVHRRFLLQQQQQQQQQQSRRKGSPSPNPNPSNPNPNNSNPNPNPNNPNPNNSNPNPNPNNPNPSNDLLYKVKWLLKVGSGKPKSYGVWPVAPGSEKFEEVWHMYEGGEKCGQVGDSLLAQAYMNKPLLVDGYKFDFRVFMVIASVNPLIVFAQKTAEVSRCALPFNLSDHGTPQRHLCENFVARQLLREFQQQESQQASDTKNDGEEDRENEKERAFQRVSGGISRAEYAASLTRMWTANDVQQRLLATGAIDDPNWVQSFLLPETYKVLIYLAKMTQPFFPEGDSRYFEFFAPEFALDENKKIYLLGVNANPKLENTGSQWNYHTVNDILEIQYAYLHSRFKRIHKFVQDLLLEIKSKGSYVDAVNWEEKKKKFQKINMNYLEKDIVISPSNSFAKILDENNKPQDPYMGYIKKGCI